MHCYIRYISVPKNVLPKRNPSHLELFHDFARAWMKDKFTKDVKYMKHNHMTCPLCYYPAFQQQTSAIAEETSQLPIDMVESYNFPYSAILRAIIPGIESYDIQNSNTFRFESCFVDIIRSTIILRPIAMNRNVQGCFRCHASDGIF